MNKSFLIRTPSYPTELLIRPDILKEETLKKLCKKWGSNIVILADSNLIKLYGKSVAKDLKAEIIEIPTGELAKSRKVKQQIEDHLLRKRYGKETVVIGLGGGSTIDLAGFLASTYMRGLPLILLPTSLLAIVDASIGGKTALDTPHGKNLIGTFYSPKAILADLATLKTLPKNEWHNGFAEIVKIGLVFDIEVFKCKSLPDLIRKSVQAKISIVEQDPLDSGLRRILNFGHTIGHGIEQISNYKMAHGAAVSIGCVAESYLSYFLGYLSRTEFEYIQELYSYTSVKLPATYQRHNLIKAMLHDKKGLRFVHINKIGHAMPFAGEYCATVPRSALLKTLKFMEQHYG